MSGKEKKKMAKYYEVFTKDKEKQQVCLGQCKVVLVRGFTKNNDIYHRVDIISNDNIRLLSQFIKIEDLGYYLHVANDNNSFLNDIFNNLSVVIDVLKVLKDIKNVKSSDIEKILNQLQECANSIEIRLR